MSFVPQTGRERQEKGNLTHFEGSFCMLGGAMSHPTYKLSNLPLIRGESNAAVVEGSIVKVQV
jgi:hypothetical protein